MMKPRNFFALVVGFGLTSGLFAQPDAFDLHGLLVQKDGRAWEAVEIQLLAVGNPQPVATTQTDGDGAFSFRLKPAGNFLVHVNLESNEQTVELFSQPEDVVVAVGPGTMDPLKVKIVLNYSPEYTQTRYRQEFKQFAAEDKAEPFAAGGIILAGSSTFRIWSTARQDLAPLPIRNRGFGGSTMEELLLLAQPLVWNYHPKVVVVYEGDNDLAAEGSSVEAFLANYEKFVTQTRQALPGVKLVLLSIKHSLQRDQRWPDMNRANQGLKKLAERTPGAIYLDLAALVVKADGQPDASLLQADGLHMNPAGYARWIPVLKTVLAKALAEK